MGSRFLRWVVPGEASGNKLIRYIYEQLEGKYSVKALKKSLDANACSVNDRKERFANYTLSGGDTIVFDCAMMEPKKPLAYDSKQLLYEDDDFLIYNKPAGLVYDAKGLLTLLQQKFPGIIAVHRLDKDTSGAIIYAKSEEVKQTFIHLFKEKRVAKEYLTIVDGVPSKKQGIVTASLGKIKELQGQGIWGAVSLKKGGKTAETHWKILETGDCCALLACRPVTGRTHQIRIHMSLLGHPILGDHQYGRNFKCCYPATRHLLHAWKLTFPHPLNGNVVAVTAAVPSDFYEAQDFLFGKGKAV